MSAPHRTLASVAALAFVALAPAQQPPRSSTAVPPLVDRHCGDCHRGADAEEGFDLDALFATGVADGARERAGQALARVRSRTMPPVDEPDPPTAEERRALALAFADVVPADAEATAVTMRRLSRREYANTVRDLTGVAYDAHERLPPDPRAYGFDNVGDVTSVSPLLFERYFEAAGAIAAAMVADADLCARAFAADRPPAGTLGPFLARAFRRPVTAVELQERVDLHDDLLAAGRSRTAARIAVVQSILASPQFLFRAEAGRAGDPGRLTSHELATRLAYLVTASMPDAALAALADADALDDPLTLAAEATRLAAATAGRPLAEGFGAQWLRYGDVLTANADFRRYPQIWDHALRPAFLTEATLFFADLVQTDASVLTLLDADHTFADATLRRHYGLGEASGPGFVRVALPDRRRGGILGMGAVLMVTSQPLRTSPVLRGRFVLDELLDEPPPPPPANAGVLPADDVQPDALTLRARLERHRRAPACANCHARMDPLGFALENFDVLGCWRDAVGDRPIDSKGELPDGTELDGPIALKDELLRRRDDFVRAMAKKLLVFGIGRPLVPADEREVLRVAARAIAGDCRFSALLGAVVTSPLFTRRAAAGHR